MLRRGDRIVEAQGHLVRDWDRFRALILSNDPGDTFEVLVVRDGETLDLAFQLGEYDNLDNPNPIESSILEEAWQIRVASSDGYDGPSADTGFATEPEWRKDKMLAQANWPQDPRNTRVRRSGRSMRPSATGQQARFDWGEYQQFGAGVDGRDATAVSRRRQLDIYRDYLAKQTALLEGLKQRLEDDGLDPQTRQSIVSRIEQKTSAIAHLKRWINDAERGGGG